MVKRLLISININLGKRFRTGTIYGALVSYDGAERRVFSLRTCSMLNTNPYGMTQLPIVLRSI
jgi:hypothetical protein